MIFPMDCQVSQGYSFGSDFSKIVFVEVKNDVGSFLSIRAITKQIEFIFPKIDSIYQDFSLIYGIGECTASRLHEEGYQTILDLLQHPRWQKAASEIVKAVEAKDITRLVCYGAKDFQLLSFFQPESICFIDIETVGLYSIHPVFLVGILQFDDGQGTVQQLLAPDFSAERAILYQTIQHLKKTMIIVSFNGRSFDLPYLKSRMKFHQLEHDFGRIHFDLLHHARRNYRHNLPNCRLITIEQNLLDHQRNNDIPGSEVAAYYQHFIDSGDLNTIIPVLKHNAEDLLSMARFLGLITRKRN